MRRSIMVLLSASSRALLFAGRQRCRFLAASVSGVIYSADEAPKIELYTKEGCTLCDDAVAVLKQCTEPHTLELVDITEDQEIFDAYKYDIPVLHVDGVYFAKHRITTAEAEATLREAKDLKRDGRPFNERPGRPDAKRLER